MSFLSKFSKAIFAVAVAGAISASAFSEGEDYVKLEKPLSVGQNTLVKVFSYACPFCYKYDKSVTPKVVEKIPGLKYEPFHLKTKGDYGEVASKVFAVLITMDEAKMKIHYLKRLNLPTTKLIMTKKSAGVTAKTLRAF